MVLLATMMIPFPVIMVPIFGLFKSLGWIGSFKPLWVPSFFAGAFQRFFTTAVFPHSTRRSDGARRASTAAPEFEIFWRIILPL